MKRSISRVWLVGLSIAWLLTVVLVMTRTTYGKPVKKQPNPDVVANAIDKVTHGREIFRFDRFGDEAFWGDSSSCTRRLKARGSAASVRA